MERTEEHWNAAGSENWIRSVYGIAAEFYDCMFLYRRPHPGSEWERHSDKPGYYRRRETSIPPRDHDIHILIGRPVNVEIARLMGEYFVKTIERLAKEWPGDGRRRGSFRLGAVEGLSDRLMRKWHEIEAEARKPQMAPPPISGGAAVIVTRASEKAANQMWYREHHGGHDPRRGRARYFDPGNLGSFGARMAGGAAAEGIGLDPQVKRREPLVLPKD